LATQEVLNLRYCKQGAIPNTLTTQGVCLTYTSCLDDPLSLAPAYSECESVYDVLDAILPRPAVSLELPSSAQPLPQRLTHEDRPLTSHQKARISLELAQTVRRCHQKGLLLNNLKPQHVLVLRDGFSVRLCGMGGMVRLQHGETTLAKDDYRYRTTPAFSPPEVFDPDVQCVDKATDIWLLGCILAVIWGGEEFSFADYHDIEAYIVENGLPYLRLPKVAPAAIQELLCTMLQPNQMDRPSIGHVYDVLVREAQRCQRVPAPSSLFRRAKALWEEQWDNENDFMQSDVGRLLETYQQASLRERGDSYRWRIVVDMLGNFALAKKMALEKLPEPLKKDWRFTKDNTDVHMRNGSPVVLRDGTFAVTYRADLFHGDDQPFGTEQAVALRVYNTELGLTVFDAAVRECVNFYECTIARKMPFIGRLSGVSFAFTPVSDLPSSPSDLQPLELLEAIMPRPAVAVELPASGSEAYTAIGLHEHLSPRTSGRVLTCAEALELSHSLVEMVAACHEQGRLLMNFKAQHMLYLPECREIGRRLMLMDLGAMVQLPEGGVLQKDDFFRYTVEYSPPESLDSNVQDVGLACDLWSLGCILNIIWGGEEIETDPDEMRRRVLVERLPPQRIAPGAPFPIRHLISQLWAFEPDDRPSTRQVVHFFMHHAPMGDGSWRPKALQGIYQDSDNEEPN